MTASQLTDEAYTNLGSLLSSERSAVQAALAESEQRIEALERQLANLIHHTAIGCSNPQRAFDVPVEADRIFIPGGSKPTDISLEGTPDSATLIISSKERGQWFEDLCVKVRARHSGPLIVVKGIHEPENDIAEGRMTLSQYLSWCDEDDAWTKELGFISVQCLMGSTGKTDEWKKYWQESSDQLWFDVYHGGPGNAPKAYNAPEKWLADYFNVQGEIDKPIGFAEFASAPMATDTNDTGLLSWMRDNAAFCREQTTLVAACWYNSAKGPGRFTTKERAEAWLL